MTAPNPQKRKTVKHYEFPGQPRLFAFSTYGKLPLLTGDVRCRIVADAIQRAVIRHHFILLAWVMMPDHVHLVGVPWRNFAGASRLLYAIERPSSYRIKMLLEANGDALLGRLTVRERPGKPTFRFWQEGPGHDRTIRVYEGMENAIDYVHLNPVRRALSELPEDWYWSSARQHAQVANAPGVPRTVRLSASGRYLWNGAEAWFGDAAQR
jgi:REP-associated tyrosine transposase